MQIKKINKKNPLCCKISEMITKTTPSSGTYIHRVHSKSKFDQNNNILLLTMMTWCPASNIPCWCLGLNCFQTYRIKNQS